jgi:F-type H+-transporting ATPase subunit b
MEALGQFGVNIWLLTAQIVNFLIIFYVIRRFALKPILSVLKNREKTIKEGLQQAEEARKMFEDAQEKEKELLKKAHTEVKQLLEEAKSQRKDMLQTTEAQTRDAAEKILAEARSQIVLETKEAEKRLSAHVSQLAVMYLEKSLTGVFGEKEQSEIFDKALKSVKKKAD